VTDVAAIRDVDRQLEQFRGALTGYCYRMLGSPHEAEDAVQETLLRAWRSFDQYTGRAPLRAWVFRIATNVCVDMLRGRKRRALPFDLAAPGEARHGAGVPLAETSWVLPMPDGRVAAPVGDPAERTLAQESIRLAFVAALQHLLPRQRAVVILRDVLRWKASEVAQLLGTTVVSVNSALQRARAALAALDAGDSDSTLVPDVATDPETQQLLARYVDAFERYDMDLLVSILHEDATLTMPPHPLWLLGLPSVVDWYRDIPPKCKDGRFVPVGTANGVPALAIYRPADVGDLYEAFAIQLITTSGGKVTSIEAYLFSELLPTFGLPLTLTREELAALRR
jgi:RNA polymerase sigma-70 factor (ECF subfamily)